MIDLDPATGQSASDPHSSAKHTFAVERLLIVVISLAMVILPVVEVLARKIRGQGVPGSNAYEQRLGVWLGFLGALAATAAGKHLGLATTAFLREGHFLRRVAGYLGGAVSAVTTMMLAYASWIVVKADIGAGETLPGGIPDWWTGLIVPAAFAVICLRFVWYTLGSTRWGGRIVAAAACIGCAFLFKLVGGHGHAFLWPGMLLVLAAFLLGAPVFVAMSATAMLFFFAEDTPIASVPQATLQLVQNPTLPAIPLLTLAGYIMAAGGASQRLVRAYKSLFGWLPGGLALMAIMVMALFTTFTGGSGVTILALGGLVFPALIKDKYPEGFALGLVTASGSLGLLFPPSLPVILYGAVAGVAAERLFLGALLPGIFLILVVAAYAIRHGVKAHAPRQPFDRREVMSAVWAAKFDIGLPVVVMGVLLSGLATTVESAAVGALYALVVELAVFRDVHPIKEMPLVLLQSATLVGAVVILMGVALGLTNYLVDAQIPEALVNWVQAHFHSQWTFLLALNALLLVLGSVFEIYAAIIVLAPLIAPLGVVFGVEPVHLGVVFLANLELGFLFPPMGLNLFLSASRFGKPLPYLYKQALPFLIIMAFGVLFITYVPAITTGMANLLTR